ncbi:MAG: hypothetical protein L3V56_13965, partial [Candidatus Magnetoovum sp. WYHC-5]|nr:hypothetical protein [Candidatus Magnetoovum sp. WYHC-5]
GVHIEGPFLNPNRCGALNKGAFINPTLDNVKRLIDGYENIIKIITMAPELDGAINIIETLTEKGIIVNMGHSDATYEEAHNAFKAGAKGITHIFNAMRGFHHRQPGIAGFGILDEDVYIEVIADPFHLDIKTIEMIFMVKPADRIILISDSIRFTNTSVAEKAIIDAEKVLLGGAMSITDAANRLIELGFNSDIVKNCISTNPAHYLGIEG